jgi:uncharacterized protein YeaO (DUF488 family)
MPIRTKRWNDPAEDGDGYRLLVTRYRPRGVRREEEPWDAWCIALSPSIDLHAAAYGKGDVAPIAWDEYERRFLTEMERQRFWIDGFARRVRSGETLTLLCSSACIDEARCHRTLLAKLIDDVAFPKAERAAESATRVVRRRSGSPARGG